MKRLLCLAGLLSALGSPACGDEPASTGETSGGQGASSGTAAMTAGEFNHASVPDEVEAVDQLAGANGDCDGLDIQSDKFRQGVFIDAVQAPPDTPLAEIVADQCSSGG